MDLGIGLERARQPLGQRVELLARHREQFVRARQRARRGAQFGAAIVEPARPAGELAPREASRSAPSDRRAPAPPFRPPRSASARACRRRRSIRVKSVSWPTAEISGIMLSAAARTTISSLNDQRSSSEPPPRATMMQIGARHPPALGQRIEAADRGGDLLGRAFALHPHRPDQHAARKAVREPMQDVADHRAGRRGDDADHGRQIREQLLARLVEQAFGGELLLALLEQRHQRADAGRLQALDDDLVGRAARIGREPAGRDHLQALPRA